MRPMPAGAAPDRTATRPWRRDRVAVGAFVVAVAAAYAGYALELYRVFRTSTYDLVIFDQAVRSYSRFDLPVSIAKGVHNGFGPHFAVLGDHFSPILALLAPLYWIHDGPVTLLVSQAALLALAIVPLWAFTRRRFGPFGAWCVVGGYALSWPVAEAIAFDFHELAFVPLLSMVMLERDDAGNRWQCAAAAGGLLLVKEDMGLLVAGFGGYLLTRRGERRRGALFILAGVAWTWLASRVLIPAFGGSADYYWAYSALGRDLPHAAGHVLAHPVDALRRAVTPHVKVTTMLWLLTPLLLLPLASPVTLTVLPALAARMLSDRFPNWWEPRFHYNVALVALLVAAAADGAARLAGAARDRTAPAPVDEEGRGPEDEDGRGQAGGRRSPGRRGATGRRGPADASGRRPPSHAEFELGVSAAAVLLLTLAVAPRFAFGEVLDPAFYRRDPHARAAAQVLSVVPRGALVEAANAAGPPLSGRTRVLLWDTQPRWAPWVVAEVGRPTFPFPSLAAQRGRVDFLLHHGYTVMRSADGWRVLHRPGVDPDPRATR